MNNTYSKSLRGKISTNLNRKGPISNSSFLSNWSNQELIRRQSKACSFSSTAQRKMASTPSSTLLSPLYESNTFCNFTSLQKLSFPLNNKLLHSKSVTLTTTHVSLQEQSDISNPTNPRKTASSSKSSYIWVNPQSPKASQLRQKSYDSRYASLVKMAWVFGFL